MEKNIKCLVEACNNLGIKYEWVDKESNFLRIMLCGVWEYFRINKTPFNSEVVYSICKDKMHTFHLLSNTVRMPDTISFLDWKIDEKYRKYLKHPTEESVIREIKNKFTFPLIVKQNSGALGQNVFLCRDREETVNAINEIFNSGSKYYDYIALAQQFIDTKEEYRLICAFGKPVMTYKRGNASGFALTQNIGRQVKRQS